MSTPILATKLYTPRPPSQIIGRPHLIERLNIGLQRKLTLISAPAGFGKTTLISEWIADLEQSVAWLSLDAGDNDASRFLAYVIAALQTIEAGVGKNLVSLLQSPQISPNEATLTALINDLSTMPNDVMLVLDDYHLIESQAIDEILTFLLDHLPPQLHLIITTREDPSLPLSRYRVRGQMTELRAADLRFTTAESAGFLNQAMNLNLSAKDIAALETRTEGWIAGLQLAAISMQRRDDKANFIQAFTGSHRFVLDYLAEEVLQHQSDRTRNFLLQTAILDRLNGPLCNAVTGQTDGKEQLALLERSNLFVIPLDDQRQWYRYHHLFADMLQARLLESQADDVFTLHQRASVWYEQNGMLSEAIRHAFVAKDFERAARLLELVWPVILHGFHPIIWLGWVQTLPKVLISTRPVLSIGCAWTLADHGEPEAAERHLNDAERWVNAQTESNKSGASGQASIGKMVVDNEKAFQALPATIAGARAYIAQARGNVSLTIKYAQQSLDLLAKQDHYWRGTVAMFLGLAYWTRGDLKAAAQAIADSNAHLHNADNVHLQIVGTVILAEISVAQGRLREAMHTCEQALQLAQFDTNISDTNISEHNQPVLYGTVNLYVCLSELYREWGDLESAAQQLHRGEALGDQPVSPGSTYRLYIAMARTKESQGQLDDALNLLQKAEYSYKQDAIPNLRPAAALKARLWVKQGRLTEALDWVHEQGLSANDDLSYLSEFTYLTLARIYIAEYQLKQIDRAIHEAISLLERLLNVAEEGGRMGSMIEILVVQALAHQAQGDIALALVSLKRALTLAEPEGYIRIFVDEGQSLQTLLRTSLKQGANPVYVTQLLSSLNQQTDDKTSSPATANQHLVEPLSSRELEVLHLLAGGYTNQAVADELVIALSTVKKHVNNIYSKLGVGSRTQAINLARELDIL